jgi:quaternary ammonium compound-resistance protein SugE
MAWLILIIAGFFEIIWAVGLKATGGLTRLVPSALTISAMLVSFVLLAQALKTLPMGTAYAVWTGIGTAGAAICGIWFFNESKEISKFVCIGLILIGIIGLRIGSKN